MPRSAAARRYARALFALANEAGRVAETRRELADLSSLLEAQPELRDSLFRPLHPAAQRLGVMGAVAERLGASDVVSNFYAFLIERRRLVDFAAIRSEYERLADDAEGRTEARVVSAAPLGDEARQRIERALSQRTGREVRISIDVDPGLIGGVVAQVGDLVFDGSLRSQLDRLRASLTKG